MRTQSKQSVPAAMMAAASKSAAITATASSVSVSALETASSPAPVVHAIAGSIGGAVATILLYPLELIRVEIQARGNNNGKNKHVVGGKCKSNLTASTKVNDNHDVSLENNKEASSSSSGHTATTEPPAETNLQCFIRLYKEKSLYRGASSMVTTLMISNFILFYTLQVTRAILSNLQQQHNNYYYSPHSHYQHQHGRRQILILRLPNHIRFLQFLLPKSNIGNSLLASSLAGVINVFLTTPLWVGTRRIMESPESFIIGIDNENNQCREQDGVLDDILTTSTHKQQKQMQKKKQPNLWNVMHQIAQREGILQLWNGTWSSLLLVSNPAIQYFLYEQIRLWLLSRRKNNAGGRSRDRRHHRRGGGGGGGDGSSLTPAEAFVFGAMAKTVATVITYPLQLAQVLIRLRINEINDAASLSNSNTASKLETADCQNNNNNNNNNMKAYTGVTDCLYDQFTRGGVYSLFQGMNSKLLQTVLSAAFTFLTYEQTLVLVGRVHESLG